MSVFLLCSLALLADEISPPLTLTFFQYAPCVQFMMTFDQSDEQTEDGHAMMKSDTFHSFQNW